MRKLSIVVVFLSIMFISIGYSALNTNLTISGELVVRSNYGIQITNIYIKESFNDATELFNSTFTTSNTNMGILLPYENSEITLIVEVTNFSSEIYHLDNVIELMNNNSDIGYEIKDKEVLYFAGNSVTEIEISFYHNNYNESNVNLNLNLNYEFVTINYQNLEYIVYSGTQYIDSGLLNTGDYIFETEFNMTGYVSDGGWIVSGRTSSSHTLGVFLGRTGVFSIYGGPSVSRTPVISPNTGWHTFYFSRTESIIDNRNYYVSGQILIDPAYERTIRIGGATVAYTGGEDTRHFIGYMKNFKITDAVTGEVLRYFVPCKLNESGEIGYFDVINDVFYNNAGTGVFLEP